MVETRYKSTFGFIDLLFNLLVGFVALFFLAFLLINPIAKKDVLDPKAEYMIIMDWDSHSNADIDVWVQDERGTLVYFLNKDKKLISIDRDDLGSRNDTVGDELREVNREVVTIKSKSDRILLVNIHYYSNIIDGQVPQEVSLEFIRVNPYKILKKKIITLEALKQEKQVFGISIQDETITFFDHDEIIVGKHTSGHD